MSNRREESSGTRMAFSRGDFGFTLLELLAVLTIVGVLAVLVIPPANQILRGWTLTQSGDRLVSLLILARQTALTKNAAVEVRFYQFGDASVSGQAINNPASGHYRAIQLFSVDSTGTTSPMGKVEYLAASVLIDSGAGLSSLLGATRTKVWDAANPQVSIPRCGTSYNCRAFRFLADGSTNLSISGNPWFLTLHSITSGDGLSASDVGPNQAVPNYLTVQVDFINGSVITYRP